jgi:polar amino acid transport system substrate-binding protein
MKLILPILMAILFSVPVNGAEKKAIVVAADPWPPYVDPQDEKQGLSLEIIRAAYKTQGYDVIYKNIPWARAEDGVKTGIYDVLPDVWFTEARTKDFMYSKPYASNDIKFIALKNDPFEFDGIKSLSGKRVGVIRGYVYSEEFTNAKGFKQFGVPDFMLNMKKLISKRIDLTLEDEIVARQRIAKEDPKLLDQVRFSENSLSHRDLYIASGYKNPRHQEIIEAFNKGLAAIKANGVFSRIMKSNLLAVPD